MLILVPLALLLIPSVMAVCTVTFDKVNYSRTETIVAAMSCTENPERNIVYHLAWYNITSGELLQNDTGITPAVTSQLFYKTYTIPFSFNGTGLNASLRGTGLEGSDSANVTGAAANSLFITDVINSGKWVGTVSSTSATLKDENGYKISGAFCHVHVFDATGSKVLFTADSISIDGDIAFSGVATYTEFEEGIEYRNTVHCYCGAANTTEACIDENGIAVSNSIGSADSTFFMNKWVTFSDLPMEIAYVNGTLAPNNLTHYAGYGEKVYWYSNKTNNYPSHLTVKSREFLINNATGLTAFTTAQNFSMQEDNTTYITRLHDIEIPASTPTGVYYVRQYYDVFYQNILVAQYIEATETFNVTGTADTFKLEGVVMDSTSYYVGMPMQICGNITSAYDTRVEFEISYRYRCGNSTDITGLSAIDSYTETRGINPNANQLRCANLRIPYSRVINYINSSCQAIVTVESDFINTFDNKITLQGPNFNIIDFGMYPRYEIYAAYPMIKLSPDWRLFDDIVNNLNRSYYRAKINISKLEEGILDPTDKVSNSSWDVYSLMTSDMPCIGDLYNYSVEYSNGTQVDNEIEIKTMQWTDRLGKESEECVIGIENINLSDPDDDYFVVKVWYEDFNERQTEALEEIANKTGIFHLDVNCPNSVIANDITCTITAYIESGEMEKEVDFTCYLNSGISSRNWNSMVSTTPYSVSQTFDLTTIGEGTNSVTCKANYYNLGSRTDTFRDTFTFTRPATGGGGGGSQEEVSGEGKKEETIQPSGAVQLFRDTLLSNPLYFIVFVVAIFLFLDKNTGREEKEHVQGRR